METSKLAWELLRKSVGNYQGRGVNHEKENFTGHLRLEELIPGKALSLSSTATGDAGEIYHHEKSWIGFDISGALVLYVASNNHPAITPHAFHRVEEKENQKNVVFRFGDPANKQSFREEITFSVFPDGRLAHHYAWGLPGGDFEPRSGFTMSKSE